MKIYRHKLRLIIHLTLLVASCVWSTMLFIEGNLVFGGFIVLIVLHCSYSIVVHYSMIAKKVAFMFDAVENDDFTFRFTGNRQQINSDQMLNESLNRIKELVLDARMTAKEREKYYELILSNIQSGIMVFNKSGVIFQVNHRVLELFGLSQLTHIRQLDLTQEKLSQHFFSLKDGESAMVKFYNEVGEVSISISAVHLVLRGIPLKIVSLTDIAANLDSQEIENWQRISRVLTHEIMNTLSPISSLSQTLLQTQDREMIQQGLEVIAQSSEDLHTFVDNYRRLTRLPTPHFTEVELSVLVVREVQLLDPLIPVNLNTPHSVVTADRGMISQVVVNLLKNAIEVCAQSDTPTRIWVDIAQNENGRIYVDVCNTGEMITPELRENIFVPFFTTKTNGNGVGLSLSKQIMRLNQGSLTLSVTPFTRFRMQF